MRLEKELEHIRESDNIRYLQGFGKGLKNNKNYSPKDRDKMLHHVNIRLRTLGALTVGLLLFLSACTYKGEQVLRTLTDNAAGYKKEWLDTTGDGRVDTTKTYFICNGKTRSEPSTVYDRRRNILYVDRPLARYSNSKKVVLMEKDDTCK